jgi:hypothetical protein
VTDTMPSMPPWSVRQDGNYIVLTLGSSEGFELHLEWEPRAADDGEWILMTPPDHSFRVHDSVIVSEHGDYAIDLEGVVDMRVAGPERSETVPAACESVRNHGAHSTSHEDVGDRAYIACLVCGRLLDDIGPAGTVDYDPADVRPAAGCPVCGTTRWEPRDRTECVCENGHLWEEDGDDD